MSTVIICEKPSQARNLRAAFGDRHGRILAAQGHLLRLEEPEEVNPHWKVWGLDVLKPSQGLYGWRPDEGEGKAERLKDISNAMSSASRIIIATDCDREGQAIGESLVRHFAFEGDVLRAMFTAEDEKTLNEAFANLKPNSDWRSLYDASVARSQSDHIFNLTMTRAASVKLKPDGWRGAIGIGRVRTPTLGLVCAREQEIRDFHPRDFFEIEAEIEGSSGRTSLWYRPRGDARIFDAAYADRIALAACDYAGPLCVERAARKAAPPRPFDLPALQKHAGKWGWTAKQVLDVAQALYERHKVITYPRAETRYLPENLIARAGALAGMLRGIDELAALVPAEPVIRKGKSGIWSDAGIAGASHHALIPNVNVPDMAGAVSGLDGDERRLFDAIAKAFIAGVSPDHEFDETTLSFVVDLKGEDGSPEEIRFQSSGKVVTSAGWKAVLASDAQQGEDGDDEDEGEDAGTLPAFVNGEDITCGPVRARTRQTTAPRRYTEGDLIDAMQNAWKFVSDEGERDRLKEAKGIGTPATRDSILEGLKRQGFLTIERKNLVPTEMAMWLYDLLCDHAPELVDPGATARMEARLDDVLSGSVPAKTVIDEIAALAGELVGRISVVSPEGKPAFKRPPSAALLAAAKDKAKREGKRLPRGAAEDAQICKDYLGPRREAGAGPSDKQVSYARKLAAESGEDLADETLKDSSALSKWIDRVRALAGKDLASPKQRDWIERLVGDGAKAPKGYPDKISAADAKAFLDKAFAKNTRKRK
ncbi:DNA topoisomerase [Pararhodobacter sp.]|uniref:DNA topoisomerase n=1 Tax=Pararhodobacter sp. TaxID=2127056 RepID=UPI002AFFD273|nr:DNA topoisomerase [Pararhodobacter sp.]